MAMKMNGKFATDKGEEMGGTLRRRYGLGQGGHLRINVGDLSCDSLH